MLRALLIPGDAGAADSVSAIWDPKLPRATLLDDDDGEGEESLDGRGCSGVGYMHSLPV